MPQDEYFSQVEWLVAYYLLDELKKNNGRLTVRAKPGALCDKVAYLSRRAMPQLKEQATSYCYRHRFSGALHHAGLDAESIGKSLGHIVDQSSQHYGKGYRSAATGFLISDIQAAKPVKLKNRIRANANSAAPQPTIEQ